MTILILYQHEYSGVRKLVTLEVQGQAHLFKMIWYSRSIYTCRSLVLYDEMTCLGFPVVQLSTCLEVSKSRPFAPGD